MDQEDTNEREHTGEAQTKGDDKEHSEGDTLERDRAEQDHKRRGAGDQATRNTERKQAAPGDRLAISAWWQMAMRRATVVAMQVTVVVAVIVMRVRVTGSMAVIMMRM